MSLRIRNWEKWQSYRKDRGQPPWIKIHREVMRNPDWVELSDAQRGQLVAIWLLAADRRGVIPASPATIRKLCYLDDDPDLNLFIDKGFIEPPRIDVNVTPERRQDDAPETETETETETEEEKEVLSEASASDARPPKKEGGKRKIVYTELFLTFWRGYPTDPNMSKKEAFDAWRRLSPEDHSSAIASLPSFKVFCAKDPTYRPIHACRYLTKRRFEGHLSDDLTPEERADIAVASERGAAKLGYVKIGTRWVKQEESAA